MFLAISVMFVGGQPGIITEEIIREGAVDKKIVVIRLEGIITNSTSTEFSSQLNAAAQNRDGVCRLDAGQALGTDHAGQRLDERGVLEAHPLG